MEINLTEINAKLINFSSLPVVESKRITDEDGFTIRKITDELFIKVYTYEDSYGADITTGLEFVKAVEKQVTNYEAI
tara:strand:- start:6453 stop:6683 length:231 start_codon:yes stop_codon:yes gene_type:complete